MKDYGSKEQAFFLCANASLSKVKHAHFSVFKVNPPTGLGAEVELRSATEVEPPKGQATLLQIPTVEACLISISAY